MTPNSRKPGADARLRNGPVALPLILLLALSIRTLGIWQGYPYSYDPDEVHFIKRALAFGSMDFNPHWFHKPAFYMYVLFAEYGVLYAVGLLVGLWHSLSDFAVRYVVNPGIFYLIGRATSTLLGVATIAIVYRFGNRFLGKSAGFFGALLLTFAYAHVAAGQIVKADVAATFFAFLSMYLLFRYLESARIRDLCLSAAAAGLGTATKYYPIVMLVPIALAVGYASRGARRPARTALVAGGAGLAAFWGAYFAGAPYNFLDPLGRYATFYDMNLLLDKAIGLFGGQTAARPGEFIEQPAGLTEGAVDYVATLFAGYGMGIPIAAIGFAGLLIFVSRLSRRRAVFLSYPVVFAATSIVSYPGYAEPRHQLTVYPYLALMGGWAIAVARDRLRLPAVAVALFVALLLAWPATLIVQRGLVVAQTDTRQLAKDWIEANLPAGSRILVNEEGPHLLANEEAIRREYPRAASEAGSGQFTTHYRTYLDHRLAASGHGIAYDIDEIRFPWWRSSEAESGVHELTSDYDRDMANPVKLVGVRSYDEYVELGYDYAVVHGGAFAGFLDPESSLSKSFPSFARFYTELFEHGRLVRVFPREPGRRPGPEVRIYAIQAARNGGRSDRSAKTERESLQASPTVGHTGQATPRRR